MTLPFFLLTTLVWTGLLWGIADLLTRPPTPPRFAQMVWRGAAVLMVTPWAAAAISSIWPEARLEAPYTPDWVGAGFAEIGPALATAAEAPAAPGGPSLGTVLIGTLIAGWVLRGVCMALGRIRLQSIKRRSRPARLEHQGQLDSVACLQRLHRTPELRVFDGAGSPFVAGVLRPTIFVPETSLQARDLTAMLAHECAHIRRGDLIWRPLERFVADLLWFSPFAWMARTQLDHWREVVCDAEAIASTGSASDYARALVEAARTNRGYAALPAASFISPRRKSLPRRIDALIAPQPGLRPVRGLAAAAIGLVALPLALAQTTTVAPDTSNGAAIFSHPLFTDANARLTSSYGLRRDPFTKKEAWHSGIDVSTGEYGTPIHAPADGHVVYVGEKTGYGKLVDIKTEDGRIMRFAQLEKATVKVGQEIAAGDIVGKVGSSGRSRGPHLHFELKNTSLEVGEGQLYDPLEAGVRILADG